MCKQVYRQEQLVEQQKFPTSAQFFLCYTQLNMISHNENAPISKIGSKVPQIKHTQS